MTAIAHLSYYIPTLKYYSSEIKSKGVKRIIQKTGINKIGNLEIGGFDLSELVSEYGSPLYIYDEKTIRNCARSFLNEFKSKYNKMHVSYSSKAFINPALVKILNEENLGIDVVSGGELEVLIRSSASSINWYEIPKFIP